MVYAHNSDELYHYGVKGMRWGHRKASYQNTATRSIRSTQKMKRPSHTLNPNNDVAQRAAKNGNSILRQQYLDAKANKKAANKTYTKAFNKAYNRNYAMLSPIKKHRDANNERWNDAAEKGQKSYEADQAYKKAKKEYHQTDEYKAKRAKAIKVGAAVAGTALAAYGAYKVSNILKDKASTKSYEAGKAAMDRWMAAAKKESSAGNWQRSAQFYQVARETARRADARTDVVKNSTVEAAKYLYNTRKR